MRHGPLRLTFVASAGLLIHPWEPFPWDSFSFASRPVCDRETATVAVRQGGLRTRHRPNTDGVAFVAANSPADARRAVVAARTDGTHDHRTRPIAASAHPRVSESWDDWMQVPMGQPRGRTQHVTPGWAASQDGRTRTTPRRPNGAPFASEEGPYYRTKEPWGAFRLTIQYRALDRQPVTPRPPPFPHTNQDFSDSGIYIFDRYEVQIIDPTKFDSPSDPEGGVPAGGVIEDDPRMRRRGQVVPNNRDQQVPGCVYGVAIPGGRYINRAHKTGEWNTLVIEFQPPELDLADPTVIKRAAWIKTMLNGHVVFDGEIQGPDGKPLNGTGVMRNNPHPVARGYIYLQSHWGSQVEFRDPKIEEVSSFPSVTDW